MFSAFGNIVGRPVSWFLGQSPVNHPEGSQSTSPSTSSSEANLPDAMNSLTLDPYEPSNSDVLVVKAMLNRAFALPLELINTVLDMAEYWPHSSSVSQVRKTVHGGRRGLEDQLLAISKPLGFNYAIKNQGDLVRNRHSVSAMNLPLQKPFSLEAWQRATGSPEEFLEHPCRKIVFSICSCDQGWSGDRANHGTYKGSFTWFDAGLERLDAVVGEDGKECKAVDLDGNRLRSIWPEVREQQEPGPLPSSSSWSPSTDSTDPPGKTYALHHELLPDQAHQIQANVHAKREFTDHKVVWRWTDDIDPDSPEAEEELVAKGRGKATGNGEFVRSLTLGDVVSVWGRARFPAWHNTVLRVQIDVYWAV